MLINAVPEVRIECTAVSKKKIKRHVHGIITFAKRKVQNAKRVASVMCIVSEMNL